MEEGSTINLHIGRAVKISVVALAVVPKPRAQIHTVKIRAGDFGHRPLILLGAKPIRFLKRRLK